MGKTLSVVDKIEQYTSDALMEMSTMKADQPPSSREFRTSSLPFCPIKSFLRDPGEDSYSMSHYTSIGTAMHLTVQTWLARTKRSAHHLYGNWMCTGCGKKKAMCKLPKPCTCGLKSSVVTEFHRRMAAFWMYEEIAYDYFGLSGHIDLVYWPEPEFAYVVDLKTTDLVKKKSSSFWSPAKPSSPSYVVQIRTYCTVLDLQFNLPIVGWTLANLNRSTPIQKPHDFHLITSDWDRSRSNRWDKILEKASNNDKRLVKLEQAIDTGNRSDADKWLDSLIKHRPCTTELEYRNWMAYSFFTGGCELKKDCLSCKPTRIKNSILKTLNEKS